MININKILSNISNIEIEDNEIISLIAKMNLPEQTTNIANSIIISLFENRPFIFKKYFSKYMPKDKESARQKLTEIIKNNQTEPEIIIKLIDDYFCRFYLDNMDQDLILYLRTYHQEIVNLPETSLQGIKSQSILFFTTQAMN